MRNRQEEIKQKGFNMRAYPTQDTDEYLPKEVLDFNKLRVGPKNVNDISFNNLGTYKKIDPRLGDKEQILRAIKNYDLQTMREVSDFFYKTSGIYARILRYMAFMYRYDWYVTPYVNDTETTKDSKILEGFYKSLNLLDNFGVKKQLGEIALTVLRKGVYYGYKVETSNNVMLQELPVNYCRSRFTINNKPSVEFNMKFFDECFRDAAQRMKVLKAFPPEFAKGYVLYKQGKLPPEVQGDTAGWYLLDINNTVRFTVNGEEFPSFISVIPLIIDLDSAQDLDKKRTEQRLLKMVIQKMPTDKNGDLIFDVEEAQQLHNNAVKMVGDAIGVSVLTTFADVEVASVANNSVASAQSDDLERVERQVYNESGVSQMQFNSDNSVALEQSRKNDESTMYNLLLQFEDFLNGLIEKYNKNPKKFYCKAQILTTTWYNYTELSKMYKEQMQLGFSKILPQLALGQTQSSILANAYFENDILDLVNVFIPPLMSSTMNSDILNRKQGAAGGDSSNQSGRPTNESQGKVTTEKTQQNKESQGNG